MIEPLRKLAVIGQGYVGLNLALVGAEAGRGVVGFDLDRSRIERLRRGESYVDDSATPRFARPPATTGSRRQPTVSTRPDSRLP